MQITIHNINDLKTIDYREVTNLQGALKDLDDDNEQKLFNVLTTRGFRTPIFVYRDKGGSIYMMDGHQRHYVMTKHDMNDNGSYAVPYVEVPAKNLQEAQAILLEITSQYGTITKKGLDNYLELAKLPVLETMKLVNFDLLRTDPTNKDDKKIEVKEDEPPALDKGADPISVQGGVYQLGRHRLMCGSATNVDNVTTLMDGNIADMVFTDPPYGVNYQSNMRTKSAKFDVLKNDDTFITDWIAPVATVSTGFVFVWTSWKVLKEWIEFTEPIGDLSNLIIWNKGGGGMGDLKKTFSSDYEVALVFNRGSELTGKRIGSVWDVGKDSAGSYHHPTQKPVGLAATAILSTTQPENIVLDVFGGSGSTLIAAEQTERTCYMMDIDPRYVDVIRKRYWQFINDGNVDGWELGTPSIG